MAGSQVIRLAGVWSDASNNQRLNQENVRCPRLNERASGVDKKTHTHQMTGLQESSWHKRPS